MIIKKPKTGGEIDSFCTKCKLDLTHRIIAMVDGVPKKVECKTCQSHHLYRKPKGEASPAQAKEPKAARVASGPGSAAGGTKRTMSARASAAAKAERDATAMWEHAIAGQPPTAFRAYKTTQTFAPGQLVRHSKFGDGVVARVIDRAKIEILFQDGARTMAHGLE